MVREEERRERERERDYEMANIEHVMYGTQATK